MRAPGPPPPPRAPQVRAGLGRGVGSRLSLGPLCGRLCLTASSLPFLRLKESLDTRQFDLCAGSVSGGRWRSWSGAASMPGLSSAGGGGCGTRASAPGPRPAGLPVGRICEVCPRVLGGLVISTSVLRAGITGWTCCLPCASLGSRTLGSLSPHLQADGGFASSGSHWGCLEGLRAGPLGPAFVAGGDSDVWALPATGRTLGCVQPAGQGYWVWGGGRWFWNRPHVDSCPGEVPRTPGASWRQCVVGGRACEASPVSPAPGHTAEALGAAGRVCLVTFSWARVDDVFRGDSGQ